MVRIGSVLVVDDEFLVADLHSTMLREIGLDVCGTAATAMEALALAKAHAPELVLMDVRLKGKFDGIEAAETIRGETGALVIFVTGSNEPATLARIERNRLATVLQKPVRLDELKDAVLRAIALQGAKLRRVVTTPSKQSVSGTLGLPTNVDHVIK
jgi:CheY-like chemotaxis protein